MNESKSLSMMSGPMPTPLSDTITETWVSLPSAVTDIFPFSVNLFALVMRLFITCRSFILSMDATGSSSRLWNTISLFLSTARRRMLLMLVLMISAMSASSRLRGMTPVSIFDTSKSSFTSA